MPVQMHLALGDAGGGHGVELHNSLGGDAFPAARLAHNGQHLSLMQGKGDAPHGFYLAGVGVEGDVQIVHVQNHILQIFRHGAHLLKRGSKASRRPSPSRLNESMVRLMAMAGIHSRQGYSWNTLAPSWASMPQEGWGTGTPMPM